MVFSSQWQRQARAMAFEEQDWPHKIKTADNHYHENGLPLGSAYCPMHIVNKRDKAIVSLGVR